MKPRGRDFRLIPVVLLATICLFALKVSGLVIDGGYTLAERLQGRDKSDLKITTRDSVPDYPKIVVADQRLPPGQTNQKSWAQEMFNYGDTRDVTGSVGHGDDNKAPAPSSSSPPLKVSDKPPEAPKLQVGSLVVPMEDGRLASAGERAVLERLQERRKELDTRTRELEMRENLLKATEQRLDGKVAELKEAEARVNTLLGTREKVEAERFKSIVTMYENMKSKDAARILERLDMRVLVEVATQIKPAKMAEIMAAMSAEAAERLTMELAQRADGKSRKPDDLPKIEGKPTQ